MAPLTSLAAESMPTPTPTPTPLSENVIFSENWNSGAVDEAVWSLKPQSWDDVYYTHPPVEVVPVTSGSSDYCFKFYGYAPDETGDFTPLAAGWALGVVTRRDFQRGGNLRLSFKAWWTTAAHSIAMSGFFNHLDGSNPKNPPYYGNDEGIIASYGNPAMLGMFERGVPWANPFASAQRLDDLYTTGGLWLTADSKPHALTYRITLGNERGCKVEYSQDGAGWTTPANGDSIGTGSGTTTDSLGVGFGISHVQYGACLH